ncbi:MAG: transcription-repair coupling factor, partial [Vampirovibrionia bacterium]
ALEYLINQRPSVIIINAKTLLQPFLSVDDYLLNSFSYAVGDDIDIDDIIQRLINIGYTRVPMVMDPGEFSVRGDICDIYPMSSAPVRLEIAFDEVESIRSLDVNTQRSVKILDSIIVRPRYKVVITDDNKAKFLQILNDQLLESKKNLTEEEFLSLNDQVSNIITQIEEFKYFEGVEYFAPYIHDSLNSIVDFLSKGTMVVFDESYEINNQVLNYYNKLDNEYNKGIKSGNLLLLPYLLHFNPEETICKLNKFSTLNISSLPENYDDIENYFEFNYDFVPSFMNNLKEAAAFVNNLKRDRYNVIITTEYPKRVQNTLSEWNCKSICIDEDTIDTVSKNDTIVTRIGLTTGFILPDLRILSITDKELFGKRPKKPTISKKTSKRENLDFFLSPADVHENDFVVHARHGIGKFVKLQQMCIDNQYRDYLTIEYQGKDKLYVPVDQINLLTRYRGSGDTAPKLSKMGGADWENIKRKAAKSIEDIAMDLLNLYAKRSKVDGYPFDADSNWQIEMEDAFEYVETPDQLSAINDVKADMESYNPMDRLICGDVGYGKTEVAIRAVFKAVLSGKQVAILVPTTILAQQHFNTIKDRFLPYPVNIGLLSRFRTPKQQKEIIKNLITGDCDIVVGTHRLLQKDVEIKNLGLVVIDEEHRFGVKNKEKLKQLREHVDVLSMSATPIPRTLYMALSGIRNMSVINTPPVNRSPIKTFVGAYSDKIIKSAVLRELEREGQVYYVHNRVQSIHKVSNHLQELMPDVRIAVGHGQMNERELENVMINFSNHEFDILLCTTIIESGLDIPNVNTIIIDDADYMGLAQLYQLRGRVGRSDRQAYAFCFYKQDKLLTSEAKKRLMAIREFNTLGGGYQVALRDLEIRGIGNILGTKQHGRMVEIGFDLYCEMLEEAVLKLKGQEIVKKFIPIVDINITAFIPDTWINDKELKIIEYKRLAAVESQRELDLIVDEWKDRFGSIPDEVMNLVIVTRIRLLASEIGFNLIREEKDFVRIFTNYDFKTWKLLTSKIQPHLVNRTKWIKMPDSSVDGISSILIKYSGFTPKHLLNFIEELCLNLFKSTQKLRGDNL